MLVSEYRLLTIRMIFVSCSTNECPRFLSKTWGPPIIHGKLRLSEHSVNRYTHSLSRQAINWHLIGNIRYSFTSTSKAFIFPCHLKLKYDVQPKYILMYPKQFSANGQSYRAYSWFAPSKWEKALLCNDASHWLGANLESALVIVTKTSLTFHVILWWHSHKF